ncbi:hypothetical protein niasHS_006768 [Heterodera schachtii]|uniref:Uncharacterized protein n=1 Tax=Heterodera schachtii TaxID=97005 RepID=A0ABD2JI76_HETSC
MFCRCFPHSFLLLLPVLLALLSLFKCISASNHQPQAENVLLEELIQEIRKLNDRMEPTLGRGGNDEEEQMSEIKRSQGPELWNRAGDKRAQLPFSGGIYGKRSPLPFSGGIYGKRSARNLYSSSLIFPTLNRQARAMPFNGGMYGK